MGKVKHPGLRFQQVPAHEALYGSEAKDLRKWRTSTFLDDDFQGMRPFESRLVDLIRSEGTVGEQEMLEKLNVNDTDVESIKSIKKHLDILSAYHLIAYTAEGWAWRG